MNSFFICQYCIFFCIYYLVKNFFYKFAKETKIRVKQKFNDEFYFYFFEKGIFIKIDRIFLRD